MTETELRYPAISLSRLKDLARLKPPRNEGRCTRRKAPVAGGDTGGSGDTGLLLQTAVVVVVVEDPELSLRTSMMELDKER